MDNPLAASLQTVARIIAGRAQPRRHPPDLLRPARQLRHPQRPGPESTPSFSPSLARRFEYFDGLMVRMGLSNNVTAFTISDFGRTLTCNTNGTDHGWGSHHFVVGGAVEGQDMYGQYPVVGVNQANDLGAGSSFPPPPSSSTQARSPVGSASPTARSAPYSPTSGTSAPAPISASWARCEHSAFGSLQGLCRGRAGHYR